MTIRPYRATDPGSTLISVIDVKATAPPTPSNLMADENARCRRCQATVRVQYRKAFTAAVRCSACGTTLVYELGGSHAS